MRGAHHYEINVTGKLSTKGRGNRPNLAQLRPDNIHSEWMFSVFSLKAKGLKQAACEMIFDMYEVMNADVVKNKIKCEDLKVAIKSFVDKVYSEYHKSNFHNFAHAVDVTQLMYFLLNRYFKKRVTKFEGFYLMIICLCHDISHPGAGTKFLNQFEILEGERTLEMFHIEKTIALITSEEMDLFSPSFLLPARRKELIQYTKKLIDATDILKHQSYIDAVSEAKTGSLPIENIAILIKVSDLANVVRTASDGHSWAENLAVEMRAESLYKDLPANLRDSSLVNLQPNAKFKTIQRQLCELQRQVREQQSENLNNTLPKDTLWFINTFAKPLGDVLKDKIDENAGNAYLGRLNESMRYWARLKLERR